MAENLVKNNEAAGRFELAADGQTGVLTYRLKPRSIVLVHTEVPEKLQGQGIAGKLAAAGLEFARQKGLTVIPLCPFVVGYLKRHQEYLDLVQEAYRGRVRG